MSAYAPESSFGWLDLDAAASEQVGTLLRSLEEPTTLDVLGLGIIRDAFASMLSPGTSTIQTRLRYFIFLPWIFRQLEVERTSPKDFAHRLRHDEARLIDCLRHLGPNQGVIGYTAGRDLKRMPSDVYWGGLGAWGIRQLDLSLSEYAKRAAALGQLRHECDDDGNVTKRRVSMWSTELFRPPDFLKDDIPLKLEPAEAQFLVDCIRRRYPNSLLAVLCATPDLAGGVDYPWDLQVDRLPSHLVETLHHARCFSELTFGGQIVYNILLARRARDELGWDTGDLEAGQRHRLDKWSQRVGERHEILDSWVADLADFWHVLDSYNVGLSTRGFVHDIVTRAVADPDGFGDDPVTHAHICDREIRLKGKRARLGSRTALENWNQQPVGGQFNYRWSITQSYLTDIAAARSLD